METQQALVANGLRHKIRLQVDGGLKTGLDIIKAAILGAESFGFGTGPMVALGCKYLRICHLNNCATGVATQDDKLRKNHYHGLPFKVTNYFEFIARETRELMAQLGVKRLVDLIGRTDLLKELDGFTAKQQKLDLGKLLETAEPHPAKRCTAPRTTHRSITACSTPSCCSRRNRTWMKSRARRSGLISVTPTAPWGPRCRVYRPDPWRPGTGGRPDRRSL